MVYGKSMSGRDTNEELRDELGLEGTLLDGKHRVDRVAARGGFGVVYVGRHVRLDIPIAIKVLHLVRGLPAEDAADLVARFLTEARTVARLRHPGIVTVLDSGVLHSEQVPTGLPWMVLDWCDGETLESALKRRRGRGGRSPTEVLDLLRPALQAIAAAHAQGVAHRDIKPSNIMLARGPQGTTARVLDFGVSKIVAPDERPGRGITTTNSGFRAFSYSHASPEQLSGARTGPWTDVYALGLLLTECLTDRLPYPTLDAGELYKLAVGEVRPTPAKFGIDVGPWEAVIARAVALRPADRFENAGDLLNALESALPRASEPAGEPRRRSPLLFLLPLFILLTLATAAVGIFATRRTPPEVDPQANAVNEQAPSPKPTVSVSSNELAGPPSSASVTVPADGSSKKVVAPPNHPAPITTSAPPPTQPTHETEEPDFTERH